MSPARVWHIRVNDSSVMTICTVVGGILFLFLFSLFSLLVKKNGPESSRSLTVLLQIIGGLWNGANISVSTVHMAKQLGKLGRQSSDPPQRCVFFFFLGRRVSHHSVSAAHPGTRSYFEVQRYISEGGPHRRTRVHASLMLHAQIAVSSSCRGRAVPAYRTTELNIDPHGVPSRHRPLRDIAPDAPSLDIRQALRDKMPNSGTMG